MIPMRLAANLPEKRRNGYREDYSMRRRPVVGIMGGARVSSDIYNMVFDLGRHIASAGCIVLTGGRNAGVMRAACEGAKKQGGLTIGILPTESKEDANPFVDICIPTNMGDARNVINVLSSDIVVACPGGAGTISEIALALKSRKQVVALGVEVGDVFNDFVESKQLVVVTTVSECIQEITRELGLINENRS